MENNGGNNNAAAVSEANEHLGLALRIGLAQHPRFPGAVHEQLILDELFEIPTQWLSVNELRERVKQRHGGLVMTTPHATEALARLEEEGLIRSEPAGRTGERRFALTPKGIDDWNAVIKGARTLSDDVKHEFAELVDVAPGSEADHRWTEMLRALDAIFRERAFHIAAAFADQFDPGAFVEEDDEEGSDQALGDLRRFVRNPSGNRVVFLRRALHTALAYHLFRATPKADEAVLEHLRGRTYFLDTTVLYALLADEGELAHLGQDMLRIVRALDCRIRVSTETIREFQNSVRRSKRRLEQRGVTNAAYARLILDNDGEGLDDFTRGYYQSLVKNPNLTIDKYADPYERIEEKLKEWNVPAPEPFPTPRRGPDGKWIQVENVEEYAQSFKTYLDEHPRVQQISDDIRDQLILHDAKMVAWIRHMRSRHGVAEPVRASQVSYWLLTRDRRVCGWDAQEVKENGPGFVPRCLPLDSWVQSVAVFVPTLRDAEGVEQLALRLLAMNTGRVTQETELRSKDLEQIARMAQELDVSPEDTSRLVTDKVLAAKLDVARNDDERLEAIKAGIIRVKDENIQKVQTQRDAHKSHAKSIGYERDELYSRASKAEAEAASLRAERDELHLRRQESERSRRRLTWVGPTILLLVAAVVATALLVPALWSDAGPLRRVVVAILGVGIAVTASLFLLGARKRALKTVTLVFTALTAVGLMVDLWQKSAVERDARTTTIIDTSRTRVDTAAQASPRPLDTR